MSTWIAVRQVVVAMEAVEREWGRQLGLDRPQLMAMLLVARRPGCPASHIAYFSGQRRQNVWRAMKELTERGLLHAVRRSRRGAEGWSLTPEGLVLARRLEARLAAWESMMGATVDLQEVIRTLERMVEAVVNRPSTNGWGQGLFVPHEARLDPAWDLPPDAAVLPAAPPPEPLTKDGCTEAEAEAAHLAAMWKALWN